MQTKRSQSCRASVVSVFVAFVYGRAWIRRSWLYNTWSDLIEYNQPIGWKISEWLRCAERLTISNKWTLSVLRHPSAHLMWRTGKREKRVPAVPRIDQTPERILDRHRTISHFPVRSETHGNQLIRYFMCVTAAHEESACVWKRVSKRKTTQENRSHQPHNGWWWPIYTNLYGSHGLVCVT